MIQTFIHKLIYLLTARLFNEEQEAAKAAARENASDELTPEQRAQDDYYKNVGVRLKRWRNMLSSTMGTAVP